MNIDDKNIGLIVERVVERLIKDLMTGSQGSVGVGLAPEVQGRGVFETVDQAAAAARRAFEEFRDCSLETRH
jgi:hypothetical protein